MSSTSLPVLLPRQEYSYLQNKQSKEGAAKNRHDKNIQGTLRPRNDFVVFLKDVSTTGGWWGEKAYGKIGSLAREHDVFYFLFLGVRLASAAGLPSSQTMAAVSLLPLGKQAFFLHDKKTLCFFLPCCQAM
jgi:hypothetical protein